ncbi:MAG: FHA domain-containing protein [Myxococcales bacterium]|nr:FHA domain-containing protein [Myxococcales bacterium]
MSLRLLLAAALLVALTTPAAADLRIKIDRYDAAELPTVHLWVSLLDDTAPLHSGRVKGFTLYADDRLVTDVDAEFAIEVGTPMAVAAVVDARQEEMWRATRDGLAAAFTGLPEGSRALAIIAHDDLEPLPKEDWLGPPEGMVASMATVTAGGTDPLLDRAVREALKRFPLAPGVEPGREDEGMLPPPAKPDDPPFPADRVLYVIGDGELRVRTGESASDKLRHLVSLARRRGVRVMAIGLTDDDTEHLWTLRVLARKTGGTYRRAPSRLMMTDTIAEAADELKQRYLLTAEVPGARRGDQINFTVRARLSTGGDLTARAYSAQLDNELGWWGRTIDGINDRWEKMPWWAHLLILGGAGLIAALAVLLFVLKRIRKARAAEAAAAEARQKALAARKPCPICGNHMMPEWRECLFCAQAQAKLRPMRFRLTGRAGTFAGEALRFDQNLVVIGAGSQCGVRLQERGVAQEHCGLRDRGGEDFVLSDFNTDGGTFVNGERISQAQLHEGDVIRVGDSEFIFGIES